MHQAADLWASGAMEASLDGIRIVALATLIVANAVKLAAMERYTKRWNGLGRALRVEKATYLLLWVWVLARGIVPGLDHTAAFVVLALLIIAAEVRTTVHLPVADRFRPEAKDARDRRQDARSVDQDARSSAQSRRGEAQDARGEAMDRRDTTRGEREP